MIQRIQTLFLLGVVICMLGTLFVPIWTKSDVEINKTMELTAFSLNTYEGGQETESKTTIYLAILAIAAAASAARCTALSICETLVLSALEKRSLVA